MLNPNNSFSGQGLKERFNDDIAKDPWDSLRRTPIMPDNDMLDQNGNVRNRIDQDLKDWAFDIQDEELDSVVDPELDNFLDEELILCKEAFGKNYQEGCRSAYDLVSKKLEIMSKPKMTICSQYDMINRYGVSEGTSGFYSSTKNILVIKDSMPESRAINTVAHELWHCRQYEISESAKGGYEDQMWALYRYNFIKYKEPDGPNCDYSDYRYQILEAEAFKFGRGMENRYSQALENERTREKEKIFQEIGSTYQERRVIYGLLSGDYETSRNGDPQLNDESRRTFVNLVSDYEFDQDKFIHDYLNYIPSQLANYVEGVNGVWSLINSSQRRNGENRPDELRHDELTLIGLINGDLGPEQVNEEYLANIKERYPNLMDFRTSITKRLGQLSRLGITRKRYEQLIRARNELEEDIYHHQKRYIRIIEDLCDKAKDCVDSSDLRTPRYK